MKKGISISAILVLSGALLTGCCLKHDWQEATCTEPKICSVCDKTKGEPLGHTWEEATCTEPKTCIVCGKTKGEALGHTWMEATCTEPKTCSVCSETEGKALGHIWTKATCQVPKTCSVCKETEGEVLAHSWQEATCLIAKTCMVCGETEGDVGDHTWVNATCLEPKTCRVCGMTEGETGDHIWMEATCSAPKTCGTCGETEGDRLFHQYPSGRDRCERCNFYGKVEISEENINYYLVPSFSRIDHVEGHEGNDYYESNNAYTWWHITVSPKSDEYIFRDCKVMFSLCYMPAGEGADRVLDVTYSTIQWTDIDNDGNGEHDERYATRPGGVYYPLYEVKINRVRGACYIK